MAEFMAIEVAEYIERGLDVANRPKGGFRVRETPLAFLDLRRQTCHAGALGLALIGKAGDPQAALEGWLQISNISSAGKFATAAGLLGISVGLARLVEMNHRNGVPATEIACSLRIGTLGLSFRNRRTQTEAAPVETSSDNGLSEAVHLARIAASVAPHASR
jgi:hypothetical protein